MTINAVRASEDTFRQYGKMTRLQDLEEFSDNEQGWRCWITEEFCMDQPARVGMGFSVDGAPYQVTAMRRHVNTKKLFACGEGPVIVAVADAAAEPDASAVRAFIIEPGDFIVLDEGIWYDACHGLDRSVYYFHLSLETDDTTEYKSLTNGAVTVKAGDIQH